MQGSPDAKKPCKGILKTSSSVDKHSAAASKLRVAANTRTSSNNSDDESSSEDEDETEEQKGRRIEFEKRRKLHYNEFEAVKLARKLIEEESEDDDDGKPSNKPPGQGNNKDSMEIEDAQNTSPSSEN